jgi:thioredoxin reductase (NADPH)
VLAVLGRGELTGNVAHLTGGAALATAVARRESQAYEVSAEGVREILNQFPALGDVILRAFIARRHLLRESGRFTGARVVGSRYSRDTLRLLGFLSKNRVPCTRIDLEADPQVGGGQRRHRFAAAVRGSSRRGVGRRSATVSAGPHAR